MRDMRFRGKSPQGKTIIVVFEILLLVYSILVLFPLANMVFSSFKTTREIFSAPFALPVEWSLQPYFDVFIERGFGRYLLNSVIVTAVSLLLVVALGSMAAYGVSRYVYRLRTALSLVFLGGIMLPLKAAVIPLFLMMRGLHLMDSHAALVIIFTAMGLPSTVFILSGFMKTIPFELEDAARIDGTNDFGIYRRIVMPLSAPSIALVTIYNAVPIWNDFFFPLVFIQSAQKRTLPLGLSSFVGQFETNWGLLFVGLTISVLPILLLYLTMTRYFIRGMTVGAVK